MHKLTGSTFICRRECLNKILLERRHLQRGFWRASKRWCKGMSEDAVNKALLRFANNGAHGASPVWLKHSQSMQRLHHATCHAVVSSTKARHMLLVAHTLVHAACWKRPTAPTIRPHHMPATLPVEGCTR